MNSRRGNVFFWIAQVLLVPAWVCFALTLALRLSAFSPILLKLELAAALVQVPCAALAAIVTIASGMGELLSQPRLRLLYAEVVIGAAVITLVFLWQGVYTR